MPITNSLAFLFTVLGEWWVEGKVISRGMNRTFFRDLLPLPFSASRRGIRRDNKIGADLMGLDTWIGMGFVLGGIALCVQSKSS